MDNVFPFGMPLKRLEQLEKSPKKVFVLGVYASAVHAKWIGPDKKIRVRALAVASEPYIFWRGEDAEDIIAGINIDKKAGYLMPADQQLNGPSGRALDEFFLAPLGYKREDAWLCDIVPHSLMNPSQKKAIEAKYEFIREEFGLPEVTIPPVNKSFMDKKRRQEIIEELKLSKASTLILLGDIPIKFLLQGYSDKKRLSDFGTNCEDYGRRQKIEINGKEYDVYALAHPRQVGQLGASNVKWKILHDSWLKKLAGQA